MKKGNLLDLLLTEGILIADRSGAIVYANRLATLLLGCDEGFLLGQPVSSFEFCAMRERVLRGRTRKVAGTVYVLKISEHARLQTQVNVSPRLRVIRNA